MRLAQDDDMVDALAPDRPDQPFGKTVLPEGDAGAMGLSRMPVAQIRCLGNFTIDTIPIPDEVTRRLMPGECLGQLACDPSGRRVLCNVNPDEVSAVQSNDDEDRRTIEANGRDHEQIHGGTAAHDCAGRCAIPDLAVHAA